MELVRNNLYVFLKSEARISIPSHCLRLPMEIKSCSIVTS